MRHKLLLFGFLFSILLISSVGIYTLYTSQNFLFSFNNGEQHFETIATAATEVSSYAKRAEGHLLLYLGLHNPEDKKKFPLRIKLLKDQLFILDQKIQNPEARVILENMQAKMKNILSEGNALITLHDKKVANSKVFMMDEYNSEVLGLHDKFSSLRRYGLELASFEIALEKENKLEMLNRAEELKKNTFLFIVFSSCFALSLGAILLKITISLKREVADRIRSEKALLVERNKLEEALSEVKTLSGLLPICGECKKVRDDKGYWNQIESYIQKHSNAEFSHGLCGDCADQLYGNTEWYKKVEVDKAEK